MTNSKYTEKCPTLQRFGASPNAPLASLASVVWQNIHNELLLFKQTWPSRCPVPTEATARKKMLSMFSDTNITKLGKTTQHYFLVPRMAPPTPERMNASRHCFENLTFLRIYRPSHPSSAADS